MLCYRPDWLLEMVEDLPKGDRAQAMQLLSLIFFIIRP